MEKTYSEMLSSSSNAQSLDTLHLHHANSTFHVKMIQDNDEHFKNMNSIDFNIFESVEKVGRTNVLQLMTLHAFNEFEL
jgi:hypothetical protein